MASSAGDAAGGGDGVVVDAGCGTDGSIAWACGGGEEEDNDGIIAGSGRSAAASGRRCSGGWAIGCAGAGDGTDADACRAGSDGGGDGCTGAVGGVRDRILGCTWRCGCGHTCSGGCDHDTVFTCAGEAPG